MSSYLKNLANHIYEILSAQPTTEMVLTLIASLVGVRREFLLTLEEVGFAEMPTRSAAVEQFM